VSGKPDGTHASDAVQRSLSLTPVLWVAGLAWGPRDLVAANAEKAVLRPIAAQSAIFDLVNIFYHPVQLFGVGSVTPTPDISDGLLAYSTQEENAKTLKLFLTFDGARSVPHACQQVKVLRALMPCRSMLLDAGSRAAAFGIAPISHCAFPRSSRDLKIRSLSGLGTNSIRIFRRLTRAWFQMSSAVDHRRSFNLTAVRDFSASPLTSAHVSLCFDDYGLT
jgi:hypothetical protein